MVVKIYNEGVNPLPAYSTENAAGLDLRANLPDGPICLLPYHRVLIPTGLKMEIPVGVMAHICSRSGMSIKNGVVVLNAPGIVDSDFRGEIGVVLENLSGTPFEIKHGDRIAQMVFVPYEHAELVSVETEEALSETERGAGGFGHTGTK